jgi:preprotein translocase subunit SecG
MGAAFGSGASGSLFGVSGSSNFLSRATAICVTIFFAASLALAYIASHRNEAGSVVKLQADSVVAPSEGNPAGDVPAESSAADVVPD